MTIKQYDQTIEQGVALEEITSALAEISLMKIKKIKSQVGQNIQFASELASLFSLVKTVALKKIKTQKPKDTISFILTSNDRFYGNIHEDLTDFFKKATADLHTEVVVIGKTGIDIFKGMGISYQPIIFSNDHPDSSELQLLVSRAKDYKRILLFYPQLKTLLLQSPHFIDLNQIKTDQNLIRQAQKMFIFEPEMMRIYQFFDSTILSLLFDTIFLEADLSRTASRLVTMDEAKNQAKNFTTASKSQKQAFLRLSQDLELLENIITMKSIAGKI